MLKHNSAMAADKLHKLLLSAIANWQAKNEGVRIEESDLYIQEIMVDSGRMLKRIRTAPQGRAHRIRKRSNHVTLFIDDRNKPEVTEEEVEEVEENTEETTDTNETGIIKVLFNGTKNKSDCKQVRDHPRVGLKLVRWKKF